MSMRKFILKNFNLAPAELVHLDEILNIIHEEMDGNVISEYELHDLFDEHLYQILKREGKL
jgi:hypothetical protein